MKKKLKLLYVLLPSGSCTTSYHDNRCFWAGSGLTNWENANSQCQAEGGTLANIDSADVQNFVEVQLGSL